MNYFDGRRQVASILQDLTVASRRPLYAEIVLHCRQRRRRRISQNDNHIHSSGVLETGPDASWTELLARAAHVVEFMSETEHAELLRMSALLLLALVLPQSHEPHVLLQQAPGIMVRHGDSSAAVTWSLDVDEYLWRMPLDERLERATGGDGGGAASATLYNTVPEHDVAMNSLWDTTLHDFMRHGLTPLLQRRVMSRQNVDLLHVVATMIAPRPNFSLLLGRKLVRALNQTQHVEWQLAQRIMSSHAGLYFHIQYPHRILALELVANHVTLPTLTDQDDLITPVLYGALPHLQAALTAFPSSSCWCDGHVTTWRAVVRLAAPTRHAFLPELWDTILHEMLEDRAACCSCHQETDNNAIVSPCRHRARAALLVEFVQLVCPVVKSRNTNDDEDATVLPLLGHAFTALTDAIEWQLDCWTQNGDDNHGHDAAGSLKRQHAPCLLASLLSALTPFWSRMSSAVSSTATTMMANATMELLSFPFAPIRHEAATQLTFCLTKLDGEVTMKIAARVLQSVLSLLTTKDSDEYLERLTVVPLLCRRVSLFANTLLKRALACLEQASGVFALSIAYRVLPMVAVNNPLVAQQHFQRLVSLLEFCDSNDGYHVVAALLSCRQAFFFDSQRPILLAVVRQYLSSRRALAWQSYQIARHAVVTGNFAVAHELFGQLAAAATSEQSYVWLTNLCHVAAAEAALLTHGAKGVPSADMALRLAHSQLDGQIFGFQRDYLRLRLDWMDLLCVLRQNARIVRLSASNPPKSSRPVTWLSNLVTTFRTLYKRIQRLEGKYGAMFRHGGSMDCLAAMRHGVGFSGRLTSSLLGEAASSPFPDKFDAKESKGNAMHALTRLVDKFNSLNLLAAETFAEPKLSGAAIVEVIDGMLLTPVPYPRDFFGPVATPTCYLMIFSDAMNELNGRVGIAATPTVPFAATISGQVTQVHNALEHFRVVAVYFSSNYTASLSEQDLDAGGERLDEEGGSSAALPTAADVRARLSSCQSNPTYMTLFNGDRFQTVVDMPAIADEGWFRINATVTICDASGNEWDLPVTSGQASVDVRVSRQ